MEPGDKLHTSSTTPNSVAVSSRSATVKVTVSPEMDPPNVGVEVTGRLNSATTVTLVDGHGMEDPPSDVRIPPNTAETMWVRQFVRNGMEGGGLRCVMIAWIILVLVDLAYTNVW